MPNWCSNYIEFVGDEQKIKTLHERLVAQVEPTKDSAWWVDVVPSELDTHKGRFLLGRTLDYEDLGAERPLEEYGYYDSVACIGSKWDPEFCVDSLDDTRIQLSSNSAWSPVLRGLVLVAKKYDVSLKVEYEEGGCDFGGILAYDNSTKEVSSFSTTSLHWRFLEQGEYDDPKDFIEEYYGDEPEILAQYLDTAAGWVAVESTDDLLENAAPVDEWLFLEKAANTMFPSLEELQRVK